MRPRCACIPGVFFLHVCNMEGSAGKYDLDILRVMYRGDMSKVRRTVTMFGDSLESEVEQVLEAFLVRDSRTLHKQLHKIRPNAQLMGAAFLLELVDSASKASHAQNYIELERCVFRMREEAAALAANLKRV